MKSPIVSLVLSLTGTSLLFLAACQSASTGTAADMKTIEVTGGQSRYTVMVPRDSFEAASPYTGTPPTVHAPNANDR